VSEAGESNRDSEEGSSTTKSQSDCLGACIVSAQPSVLSALPAPQPLPLPQPTAEAPLGQTLDRTLTMEFVVMSEPEPTLPSSDGGGNDESDSGDDRAVNAGTRTGAGTGADASAGAGAAGDADGRRNETDAEPATDRLAVNTGNNAALSAGGWAGPMAALRGWGDGWGLWRRATNASAADADAGTAEESSPSS
jgi:hypothetical protein